MNICDVDLRLARVMSADITACEPSGFVNIFGRLELVLEIHFTGIRNASHAYL